MDRPTGSDPTAVAAQWLARLVVAGMFVLAGGIKILRPEKFAEDIRAYLLFPESWTNAMAFTVPWIEVFAAVLLLVGFWRREARWLIFTMLGLFTVLKTVTLLRGIVLDCGCFGDMPGFLQAAEPFFKMLEEGWGGVIVNLVLMGLLVLDMRLSGSSAALSRSGEMGASKAVAASS